MVGLLDYLLAGLGELLAMSLLLVLFWYSASSWRCYRCWDYFVEIILRLRGYLEMLLLQEVARGFMIASWASIFPIADWVLFRVLPTFFRNRCVRTRAIGDWWQSRRTAELQTRLHFDFAHSQKTFACSRMP